jgi:hypothetical protein
MKKTYLIGALSFVVLGLVSAALSVKGVIDLSTKGIPVSLNVPEGAVIVEGVGHGLEFDGVKTLVWEVNKGDFSLEIMMEDAEMYQEAQDYMDFAKEMAENEGFTEYVFNEPNGFIYKSIIENEVYYGFYYLLVKNGHAIEFATGMESDDSNLANVRAIYAAAKGAK